MEQLEVGVKFHEAIKFMTENPGKQVKGPEGDLFRFECGYYWFLDRGGKSWEQVGSFGSEDIDGKWTIPEQELPEVEVVAYLSTVGAICLLAKESLAYSDMNADEWTKCKIKFNQGEE
jgi:hypothetical protein